MHHSISAKQAIRVTSTVSLHRCAHFSRIFLRTVPRNISVRNMGSRVTKFMRFARLIRRTCATMKTYDRQMCISANGQAFFQIHHYHSLTLSTYPFAMPFRFLFRWKPNSFGPDCLIWKAPDLCMFVHLPCYSMGFCGERNYSIIAPKQSPAQNINYPSVSMHHVKPSRRTSTEYRSTLYEIISTLFLISAPRFFSPKKLFHNRFYYFKRPKASK